MDYFPDGFPGFGNPYSGQMRNASYRFLSLSGGGYRAALYHCGFMRALRTAGLLSPGGVDEHLCVISAVSGGTITAYLWEQFLNHPNLSDPYWPEKRLLDLVTNGPWHSTYTPFLWMSANIHRRWWYRHLCTWWTSVTKSATESDSEGKPRKYSKFRTPAIYVMAETVDVPSANLLLIANGILRTCISDFMNRGDEAYFIKKLDVPDTI